MAWLTLPDELYSDIMIDKGRPQELSPSTDHHETDGSTSAASASPGTLRGGRGLIRERS